MKPPAQRWLDIIPRCKNSLSFLPVRVILAPTLHSLPANDIKEEGWCASIQAQRHRQMCTGQERSSLSSKDNLIGATCGPNDAGNGTPHWSRPPSGADHQCTDPLVSLASSAQLRSRRVDQYIAMYIAFYLETIEHRDRTDTLNRRAHMIALCSPEPKLQNHVDVQHPAPQPNFLQGAIQVS